MLSNKIFYAWAMMVFMVLAAEAVPSGSSESDESGESAAVAASDPVAEVIEESHHVETDQHVNVVNDQNESGKPSYLPVYKLYWLLMSISAHSRRG